MADLGRWALEADELDGVIRDAATAVTETLDTDFCEVLELGPEGERFELTEGVGWPAGTVGSATVPAESDSLAGYTLRTEGPVVAEDLAEDERFDGNDLLVDNGVVSGITVIVGPVADPWGVFGTHATEHREFTDDDATFVQNVANVVASAVERAETRSRLDEVYGRISDGFFALDEEWQFTYVNDRANELINPEGRDLVGETVWDAFPDAVSREFKPEYERAMYEQETVTFEEYYPDPLDAWFEVRAYPSESGLSVYFREVTERKERRRRIEEQERRLSTLMANVPGMVYRCRNERGWPMEFVSEGCRDLTGYDPEALERGDVSFGDDVVFDADHEALWEEAQEGLADDGTFLTTYRIETAEGEIRWVRERGHERSEGGEVTAIEGVLIDVTEEVRAERRLAEERDVFAEGPAMVFRWRNEEGWPVEYVSENVTDVLGYEPATLESGEVPYTDLLLDEEVDRIAAEVAEHSDETTERFSHEPYRVLTSDGDVRWVEDTTKIVRDDAGEITHYLGYLVDITERKERERELQRYETIFQAVNDGVYVVDEEGRFRMVNDAYAEMTGYDREDLIGEHVSMVVDGVVRERAKEEEAALRDGTAETAVIEAELQTADGGRLPAEATFAILPTGEDAERRVGVVRDISDRKAREQELRRYERLVENLPVGVYRNTPGPEGEFVEMNDALARIFDADSPAELMGVSVSDLYPDPETRAAFSERLEREGIVRNEELRQETLDGREIWISGTGIRTEEDGEVYFDGIVQDVTDRKERERELRETERRFEAVFEDPNILVGLLEPDGTVLDINETAMEYIDADLVEVQGEAFWETPWWGAGDDVRDDVREWTERASAGEYVEFQADLTRPNGEQYTLEGYFRPVTDDDGEVVSIIVSDRDVSERREYERRLAESEQRYRTLAEYFPNGVVTLFDHDLVYTLAAGRGFEDLPIDPDDLEGEQFRDVWPAHTADALEPAFEAALDGRERAVEVEYQGRDWLIHGVPITDERGDVFAGMTMAQDITERKERERALERRTSQQEAIAELGQFALETDDVDELMREASRQVAEVLDNEYCKVLDLDGDRRELLLRQGVGWDERIVGQATVDADDNSQAGYTLLSEQPVVVDDLDAETRFSGPELLTSHDVVSGISTVIGSVEEPWGILGTHDTGRCEFTDEDVNFVMSVANVLAEAVERRRYQEDLEQLVADLEESNERLEQFAYAASHDLQEPLRMVSSYLQLIERRYEDKLDDDGREFLEFAVDGADRMRDMIDGLLAYSRVETRGDPFETVDLDAVLADAREDLRVKIEETDAAITAESLPEVHADAGQVRQVFQNLLDNAIEYSGDETPRIYVSAERARDEYVVSVRDEGIGMDPVDAEQAFEVFQSLHDRADYDGTGIGLALSERIVERHGGEIWVESEPGQGATFSFTLPAPEDEND